MVIDTLAEAPKFPIFQAPVDALYADVLAEMNVYPDGRRSVSTTSDAANVELLLLPVNVKVTTSPGKGFEFETLFKTDRSLSFIM